MGRILSGLIALLLIGCDRTEDKRVDADNDGFSVDEGDCDDSNGAAYPGAAEYCDGADNDCDEEIDESPEDAQLFYADADGDGYGSGVEVPLCSLVTGYAENDTDCDDSNAASYPGGVEICDGRDNNCNGAIDDGAGDLDWFYADLDSDGFGNPDAGIQACAAPAGFVTNNDDCDDTRTNLNPDTHWYVDADGDGYGSPVGFEVGCAQPSGYVDNGDDCIDTDKTTFPGSVAEDTTLCMLDADFDGFGDMDPPLGVSPGTDCNDDSTRTFPGAAELDDKTLCMADEDEDGYGDTLPPEGVEPGSDCDDTSDAAFPGAVAEDATKCMIDDDGDGYGDSSPRAGVDAGSDCDDGNANINPDGTETCNGSDDDCNGKIDDDATDATEYYEDADGDGYGLTGSSLLSCFQPVFSATVDGDCDDTSDEVSPGAPEDCTDGVDNNCNGSTDEVCTYDQDDADVLISGASSTYEYLAQSMDGGDIDGDGVDDIIVGSYGYDSPSSYAGTVYVFEGGVSSGTSLNVRSDAMIQVSGTASSNYVGYRVDSEDLDGDGYDDLIIGAYYNLSSYKGGAAVFYGPVSGSTSYRITDADGTVTGVNSYDYASYFLMKTSDMDGDGYLELMVGAYAYDTPGSSAGIVGGEETPSGTVALTSADWYVTGNSSSDYVGFSGAAGDLDADGTEDFAFGAPYGENAAFIINGPISGSYTVSDADVKISHWTTSDYTGCQVAAGDMDGDGYDDLVMGSYYDDTAASYGGAMYFFYGPVTSDMTDRTDADAAIFGSASEYLSYPYYNSFEFLDMDGDGAEELVLSSSYNDLGATNGGAMFVYTGALSGSLSTTSDYIVGISHTDTYAYMGRQWGYGDIDDDGKTDLLVGGYGASSYYGEGYVFFGSKF